MSTALDASDYINIKIGSELLLRALAGYHLRRATCDDARNHWRRTLGIKQKQPRRQRALAKPATLADTCAAVIVNKASELTGIPLPELMDRDRIRKNVKTRKAICFALHRRHPELSLARLAEAIGRTDHTTACHALQTAAHIYPRNLEFRSLVDALVAA